MRWFIINILPWVISSITVVMQFLLGNKHKKAWLIGFFTQGLWVIWIVTAQAWGFIPLNIAMWIVCIRNHRKWNQKNAN